jgi:mono/diheme cytochrome c family protein
MARIGAAATLVLMAAAGVAFGHAWMAPAGAAARKNPLPRDAATVERGQAVYVSLCAECRGAGGRGDGPRAAKAWPAPTDLTRIGMHSPGDIAWKIENGRGDMPAFKDKLPATDIWALTHWIRGLKR